MQAQGTPVALGQNLEVAPGMRGLDDAEGVRLPGYGQIDRVVAGEKKTLETPA